MSTIKSNTTMSTLTVYFIPTKKIAVGQFKEKVKNVLEKLSLIDGYYNQEEGTYAHGQSIAFEYASIHDSDKNKLVPEASAAGYGAICPQCNADLDDALYDTINDYYDDEEESGKEMNMAELTITCDSCNNAMQLQDLKFNNPAMLTNHFFELVDVEDEIPADIISQIEQNLDTSLTIIYESM